MKILRSVTRRGFSVGSAGWFTVLRPNTWFPATRLPVRFRYHENQAAEAAALRDPMAPRIVVLNGQDHRLMRRGVVVMAAFAITCALLWWIMHP